MRKVWLIAATVLTVAACGRLTPPSGKVAACYVPGSDPAHYGVFDAKWGPEMRHSAGYLAAVERQRAGNCDAVFEFLNPGIKQDPEYIAMIREGNLESAWLSLILAPRYYPSDFRYWPTRRHH